MDPPSVRKSNQDVEEEEEEVETLLRRAMQTHMDDRHFPISRPRLLQGILDQQVIKRLFHQYKANLNSWGNVDVDKLCNEVHTNQIRILAMLILYRKGRTIVQLLDSGVSDAKLPLMYNDEKCATDIYLEGSGSHPKCFDDRTWSIQTKMDICRMQWYLDVPYMKIGQNSVPEHTDFRREVILPWCKPEQAPSDTDQNAKIEEFGGYSSVRQVHIHPNYHGFREILGKIGLWSSSNNFALKTLNPESNKELDQMYNNEITQLKSFNGTVAKHLVTLLTTFTHQEKRYFLFPWATCDLFSYWETQETQPQNLGNVQWFSTQLVGIVRAVHAIHWPPHIPHHYGRHGDLKPDNILWYKQYEDDQKGVLVVSDMGFTVAHTTYSRSKDAPANVARTPDYRPPEIDIGNKLVSRKYDVWTLGCIFVEMLTWFLGGKEERNQFKEDRRTVESRFGGHTYTFFSLENQSAPKANVKQSVLERMDKIRKHKYRSQFTTDVVDVIQNYMILVDPDERKDTAFLQKRFSTIDDKCRSDSNRDYAIGPTSTGRV